MALKEALKKRPYWKRIRSI